MATTTANVNKPMDPKERDADVNRKLQVYGIISAFQKGKLPSNDQIDVALNSFLASRALSNPSTRLSGEGKELINDVREVVKQSKNLLLSKNQGNLLQDFVWQTQKFDPKSVKAPGAPIDKETARQHGDQTLEGLRTLGTLIITNGQFRKLLSDATVLLRDMAGDAASNAAATTRPSEEQLSQLDRPAEDNTWHDAPTFSKDNWKKQAQGVFKKKQADNSGVAAAGTSATVPSTQQSTAVDAQGQPITGADMTAEAKEASRKKTEEYRARLKGYLSKKMPQERREQTVWRLKKMVVECQQHPDYHRAISALLDLADQYGDHANRMAKDGSGTVKDTRSSLAEAEADLRTLIERFANGTSTGDLWDSINTIYEDADRDPELKDWFRAMNRYVRQCLQVEGYIVDEQSTQDWHRLYDHGNYLLREKYRAHTNRIGDEMKFLGEQFDQDPQNKAYAAAMTKLFNHLGNDENGKPTFKRHLVKDLTDVIIPSILSNTRYIPLPRIEYSDAQFDAVIDNLVLESDNFMPNVFEVASENYLRWGRKKIANKNKHTAEVMIAGIQMDLRNVSYHIKRKQGFPALSDTGIANILLGGDGFTSRLKLSSADEKDPQRLFKADKVDVDLKDLKMKLSKSKHKFLFNLFNPILIKILRPVLKKVVEKAIRDQLNELDKTMFQVKQEADRALQEARAKPENASNIYSRYASAVQKQMQQRKKKAEQAQPSGDKKVNFAITKDDSILPNINLPGETTAKATEYKELARKGDRWESPVFSIGSAARSSDLPPAPQIVRKPHATNGPATSANGLATATNGNQAANFNQAVNVNQGVNGNQAINGNAALKGDTIINPAAINPAATVPVGSI